jgi:hypothetical protein
MKDEMSDHFLLFIFFFFDSTHNSLLFILAFEWRSPTPITSLKKKKKKEEEKEGPLWAGQRTTSRPGARPPSLDMRHPQQQPLRHEKKKKRRASEEFF